MNDGIALADVESLKRDIHMYPGTKSNLPLEMYSVSLCGSLLATSLCKKITTGNDLPAYGDSTTLCIVTPG